MRKSFQIQSHGIPAENPLMEPHLCQSAMPTCSAPSYLADLLACSVSSTNTASQNRQSRFFSTVGGHTMEVCLCENEGTNAGINGSILDTSNHQRTLTMCNIIFMKIKSKQTSQSLVSWCIHDAHGENKWRRDNEKMQSSRWQFPGGERRQEGDLGEAPGSFVLHLSHTIHVHLTCVLMGTSNDP